MEALKIFLNSAAGQHIRQVYLNNNMEWLFAPRPGFEKILSREDVLAYKTTPLQPAGSNAETLINGVIQKDKNAFGKRSKPQHGNRF